MQELIHTHPISIFRHKNAPNCLHFRSPQGGVTRITPWKADFVVERWGRLTDEAPQPRRDLAPNLRKRQHLPRPRWGWWRDDRDPELPLLFIRHLPPGQQQRLEEFLQAIPRRVREAARQFDWMHFTILRMMRLTEFAVQLAENNPALLWLVTSCLLPNGWTGEQAMEILTMKQGAIIKRLFGKGTLVTPALLRKIACPYDYPSLLMMKRLLADDAVVMQLRHYHVIDLKRLRELDGHYEILATAFLKHHFLNEEATPRSLNLIRAAYIDTLRMGDDMGIEDAERIVLSCPTVRALKQLHDRWSNMGRRLVWFRRNRHRWGEHFPDPMYEGNDAIQAIRTPEELLDEGCEQAHCAWNYIDMAYEGECTIYKVTYPERATLELIGERGYARIQQLALKLNRDPSRECWQFVRKWLDEQNAMARTAGAK